MASSRPKSTAICSASLCLSLNEISSGKYSLGNKIHSRIKLKTLTIKISGRINRAITRRINHLAIRLSIGPRECVTLFGSLRVGLLLPICAASCGSPRQCFGRGVNARVLGNLCLGRLVGSRVADAFATTFHDIPPYMATMGHNVTWNPINSNILCLPSCRTIGTHIYIPQIFRPRCRDRSAVPERFLRSAVLRTAPVEMTGRSGSPDGSGRNDGKGRFCGRLRPG